MENPGNARNYLTAREAGLVSCTTCGKLHPAGVKTCLRCGATLASRDTQSLQKVWAWWIAGVIAFIPANTYPMLKTATLGSQSESTLLGGIVELLHHGSLGIAGIVFFASIVIPASKFLAIAYLALGIGRPHRSSAHLRHQVYEVVEFVGRWSMIDVFVVAILTALVQLGSAASIHPGIAAVSFALSVAFTMLSAQSFDARLIWDADKDQDQ
ncbi:paraquat-inducible protein A [Pseudorhodobacter aquimaris]|uniref:paraquat-inducible protein A n=1 Tax=Pseudorhodobacter aquimaris TaxID=687412 RepID=UPI00067C9D9A|nr:paraquat-inducible protein A [Pseudorhodobacter aquimaris]